MFTSSDLERQWLWGLLTAIRGMCTVMFLNCISVSQNNQNLRHPKGNTSTSSCKWPIQSRTRCGEVGRPQTFLLRVEFRSQTSLFSVIWGHVSCSSAAVCCLFDINRVLDRFSEGITELQISPGFSLETDLPLEEAATTPFFCCLAEWGEPLSVSSLCRCGKGIAAAKAKIWARWQGENAAKWIKGHEIFTQIL